MYYYFYSIKNLEIYFMNNVYGGYKCDLMQNCYEYLHSHITIKIMICEKKNTGLRLHEYSFITFVHLYMYFLNAYGAE